MRRVVLIFSLLLVILFPAGAPADFLTAGVADLASRSVTGTPNGDSVALIPGTLIARGPDYRGAFGGYYLDSLLKFSLGAAASPGSTIESATFSITVVNSQYTIPQAGPLTLQFSGFGSATGAVGLDDFVRPTANVGSLAVPVGISSEGGPSSLASLSLQFDVTSLLRSIVDDGSSLVAFQIDNATAYTWSLFATGLDTSGAMRPSLAITYAATVPEPTSAAMVGIALALAIARRSARRRPPA